MEEGRYWHGKKSHSVSGCLQTAKNLMLHIIIFTIIIMSFICINFMYCGILKCSTNNDFSRSCKKEYNLDWHVGLYNFVIMAP